MGGYIYFFEEEKAEGSAKLRNLLGGKGANLAEMANLGIRVPPGFTISTEVCTHYTQKGSYPKGLSKKIEENLKRMEKVTGKKFGDVTNPLLVSVRSGARISMPGMMDTVLNLGLNDNTVEGLAKQTRNERFAYDAYRRLLQMFGNVVLGLEGEEFENILERKKKERSIQEDIDLTSEDFKEIVAEFKKLIKDKKKIPFPQDPFKQLEIAINAVFASWNNKRAVSYRKINKIPGHWGTAVNVQAMVFGNMGNNSGTGVGFTRDPATGERILYGEYLLNAQGEDVVAGIRTPKLLSKLKEDIARVYGELSEVTQKLERHYKDVQDFEFTIEEGKLYLLQTRTGKRTAQAAVKIACDMVKERLITKKEALMRIKPEQLEQLLHRRIDPRAKVEILARGLPASPGASTGKIVFTADRAVEMAEKGEKVILVRQETSPEDIHGMAAAQGILTARGGMTCVAGESLLLTTKGFFSAEEVYQMFERGENISILSYDSSLLRPKWKRIIACGRRKSKVIEIIVSQTGRSEHNSLRITSDHKMYTFHHRKLIKRPLANILKEAEYLCIIDRIPEIERVINDEKIAYLVGSILTDGYINLKRTKGNVTFTQKNTPEKSKFIERVSSYFFDVFDARFNIMRTKDSYGNIKGREIRGEAMDLICTQRKPALILEEISQNLVSWILNLDEVSILNFLAGAIDGDGVFYNNRIQIFASKERLCQAVIVACLKLGVLPQVTVNREIYDIQILERINDILNYTTRVNGLARERVYGTKFFSAKQLFSDIADKVNYKGRTKEYIKRNLLIDGGKIIRDILPICKDGVKGEIKKALNSNLRMYRVKKINEDERTYVYNFEVDSIDKLDKNYIVFTKMYTPLLISNSHAAVVARGMGKCCVAGCEKIKVDEKNREFKVDELIFKEGDLITLDGSTGKVIKGTVPMLAPELSGDFEKLMQWADEVRTLGVRANADTPKDAKVARKLGAEGIGLCRTEHMFFGEDRLPFVQKMILADTGEEREKFAKELEPIQKEDFKEIFKEMEGLPVIIRLLDPPLHEFLPNYENLLVEINTLRLKNGSEKKIAEKERILQRVRTLHEMNPMMGHRGCRLGITFPEVYKMQARAVLGAAAELIQEGIKVHPEIMIPLVANEKELSFLREEIVKVAEEIIKDKGIQFEYKIGTMIELPRAALCADKIAEFADFFSFGTNDLTQTTFGFSRDDAEGKFIPIYMEKKILQDDPFQILDQEGVGELVKIGTERGRRVKNSLEVGICGEHGGEPSSVKFCHRVGLEYVSCSPYRIPIARLAAAQAKIEEEQG